MKAIVVGAGISGLTASVLLRDHGYDVEVFETRDHIGGNCYDGNGIHQYGPHIFHTFDNSVMDFVNRFTELNGYKHRVLAETDEGIIPVPFNDISEALVGKKTDEQIINLIFKYYSAKQWGARWDDLPDSIRGRVKVRRENKRTSYFLEPHQGLPKIGYSAMFDSMAEGAKVHLCCGEDDWRRQKSDIVVYSGRIDKYFDCCKSELMYRSLIIGHKSGFGERLPAPVINHCSQYRNSTRSYDNLQLGGKDVISTETPVAHRAGMSPYYPIRFGINEKRTQDYLSLAGKESGTVFIGRLGLNQYMNMDAAIATTTEQIMGILK